MQEEIKKLFFKNINIDNDIISYVYDILSIIDYQDNDELSSLFEFIIEINNTISLDDFIEYINHFYKSYKNNSNEKQDKIVFKYSINTKNIDKLNPKIIHNLVDEPIENKKTIIEKYSLIEHKDTSCKPFIKFDKDKKIRYLNDRIVSIKGERYIDI